MKLKGGAKVSENVLWTLRFQKLPANVQTISASRKYLSEMAVHRILKVREPSEVSAITSPAPDPLVSVKKELAAIRVSLNHLGRNRGHRRRRSRLHTHSSPHVQIQTANCGTFTPHHETTNWRASGLIAKKTNGVVALLGGNQRYSVPWDSSLQQFRLHLDGYTRLRIPSPVRWILGNPVMSESRVGHVQFRQIFLVF